MQIVVQCVDVFDGVGILAAINDEVVDAVMVAFRHADPEIGVRKGGEVVANVDVVFGHVDDKVGHRQFTYFFLLPDTPDTTYHTEFRYGSDPEALMLYNDGPYAYWLAAGILANRDEQMVKDVIQLFCEENLAEMSTEEAA